MGPANTREGTGVMMISCAPADRDRVMPIRAAAFKLFGNMFIVTFNSSLGDIKRFAGSLGISPEDAFGVFDFYNPGTAVPGRAKKIASGDFTATWELTMARKDARLMVKEAGRHGVELAMVPAVITVFDDAIAHGYGSLDSTAVAKLDGRG